MDLNQPTLRPDRIDLLWPVIFVAVLAIGLLTGIVLAAW